MTGPRAILALETTQRTGGVALGLPDGRVLAERFAPARRHDDRLMPAVDALCRAAGLGPADLGGVGVSLGPGGFSGLRIGLTTAKMLARTLGLPVAGVPSALVAAAGTAAIPPDAARLLVVLASKREHAWLTRLDRRGPAESHCPGGRWELAAAPAPAPHTGHAADVAWDEVDAVLADEHLPETFRAAMPADLPLVPPVVDPAACLVLVRARLLAGDVDDPLSLAPIYPGPPEAVVRWDARHGPE